MITQRLSYMSRPHAAIEQQAWALFAVPNALAAGAVTGVLLTASFAGHAPAWLVAICVGFVAGAGPFANVSSIFWTAWSRNHGTITALTAVMGAYAACMLAAACVPVSATGLLLVVLLVTAARIIWCGIVTLRAVVWRANFERRSRTSFVARNQIVVALLSAAVALTAGIALEHDARAFRALFLAAAVSAFAGRLVFKRVRVRRERQLTELRRKAPPAIGARLRRIATILREDREYRSYLLWLFTLGAGTLMGTAPLILVMAQDLAVSPTTQVVISAALPTLMIPLTTPLWARLLARRHAIAYRVTNSYVFVAAATASLAGAVHAYTPLLWLGAMLQGTALTGGMLIWTLAHNDFAPRGRETDYLSLHVTLAGVRGLLAPLAGAACYSWLNAAYPGHGAWSLAAPLVLVAIGALGFTTLGVRAGHSTADGR